VDLARDDGVMSPLDEVGPGLWRFTVTRNGLPPTMTAYALREGEDTILVDPLVAGETGPLLTALDEVVRGRVRILVTTPFHVRGSELLLRRWRDRHEVTIFGREHCATRLDDRSAFRPLRGGETLEGGVRVHSIGRPRRAEIPFELPSPRPGLRRHRARDRRRAARMAKAPRRRASPHLVRAALPADAGGADGARRRAGARHARRAGAARRRPRVGGEPGEAAVEQVVAVLITAAGLTC
jgi:hypothetical protein